MALTRTEVNGVTVITLASDPTSPCPPICQILKTLCYSPSCFSVSQHLRRIQGASQSLLGALQIVLGLLNIGCGAIFTANALWWQKYNYLFSFWLGAMFIFFGAICILSEKYPSPCLVILNVILNLLGVCFAIAAIILYSLSIVTNDMSWICDHENSYDYEETTLSPVMKSMVEKCLEAANVAAMTFTSMFGLLIVLSVLELCVVISSAVLGIKALRGSKKGETKSSEDSEHCRRLLEDASSNPAV
ncbi:uncharacterized protein LOC141801372 [Halichoeres trimaculatus]|uniref:uncharacterized protein LOC141801372 n=1 Tax=Halichoeres trimaculatus TaxID=147232 RepID=UPI003D9EAEC2